MRDESVTEQFQRMDSEQREEMKRYMRPLMMMAEEKVDNNMKAKLPAKGIFLDLNQVNATKVSPPGRVLIETQDLVPLFILVVQVQVVSLLML